MNATSLDHSSRHVWEVAVETGITIVITVLAIVGNSLVFIAFYRDQTLRTAASNGFIISLAMTDFLFGTTRLPVFIHTLLAGQWQFSHEMCVFQGFQGFTLFCATLHTLSAISISRCCLVVVPLRYKLIFTKRAVQRIVQGIWVFSLLIGAGPIFGWGQYKYDNIVLICTFDHTSSKSYHIITNALVQINFVLMVICNVLIVKKVRDHQRRILNRQNDDPEADQHEQGDQSERRESALKGEDIHLTRTLLIVVLLFGLCWLPSAILGNLESQSFTLPRWVRLFETLSIAMNSMVNPFVYGARSQRFRRAFLNAVKCQ